MKKLLVVLMCVVMILGLMPAMAFATGETEATSVAKIDDVEYATLEEAFKNVKNDDVIVLLQDVTLDKKIAVTANGVGFDLNGNKLIAGSADKVAFEVTDMYYRFNVYDGTAIGNNEFGAKKANFDAKVYIDCDSSASIAPVLYDGTQIVYDEQYELVVLPDVFYSEYLGDMADTYRFTVCEDEVVTFFYATEKLGGIYFGGGAESDIGPVLGLTGNAETIGYHIEIVPIEPDGKSMKVDWWGSYGIRNGRTVLEELDIDHNYMKATTPDEVQYSFHESFFPGYKIVGWQEVKEYDVDYDKLEVTGLVLGDEVKNFDGSYIEVCPIWEKVETPKIDTSKEVEKVVVVTDEKAHEKAVKATEKLIADIAAGKDTDKKVSVDIKHIINKALEAGADSFDIYSETKVETLKKDEVSSADLTLIKDKVGDGTVAEYLDLSVAISVMATTDDEVYKASGKLHQLDEKMTFNIAIPKELKDVPAGMQREFYVIRVHDGKAEVLDVTVNSDETLSFETDRFSTYALAYKDTAKGEVPKTGDNNTVIPYLTVMLLAAIGIVSFKKREN